MLGRVLHYIDLINEKIGQGGSWLILAITVVVLYEVVARYVFNAPTIWGHESSCQLAGLYALLLGGYTYLYKGHVNVDVFVSHLKPRTQAIMEFISFIFVVLFCGVLLWYGGAHGIESVVKGEHSTSFWRPPVYHLRVAVAVAAFLIILQGLAKFIRGVYFVSTGRELQ